LLEPDCQVLRCLAFAFIDGRPSLLRAVGEASPDLRAFLAEAVRGLLSASPFLDAPPGRLSADAASQARIVFLSAKLEALSNIG